MTHVRSSRKATAGGAWTPPPDTASWWYGDQNIAGGGEWIDQIAGHAIAVAADCSVVQGSGLVAPVGHTTPLTSNYTPSAGGAPGVGYSVAFWVWIESTSGNIAIADASTNVQSIRTYTTPNRVLPIYVYGTNTVTEITHDFTGGEGRWWHIAVTQYWGDDGGQANKHAELYVDGVFVANLSVGNRTNAPNPLSVMAVGFAGKLDDLITVHRCISALEVADIVANSPWSHA